MGIFTVACQEDYYEKCQSKHFSRKFETSAKLLRLTFDKKRMIPYVSCIVLTRF